MPLRLPFHHWVAGLADWNEVEPLIRAAFEDMPEIEVLLYVPNNVSEAIGGKK